MQNTEKLFRLMNHDSTHVKARFESFSIEELNKHFGTNYKSIEEAVNDDPEYLFTKKEMLEYLEE